MTLAAAVRAPGARIWNGVVAVLSIVVVGAVALLILGPRPDGIAKQLDVSALPLVNAALNTATAISLVIGWRLILKRRIAAHRAAMFTALAFSVAFLCSYIVYHFFQAGPTRYDGALPWLYYPMLISHIVLAAAIVPLALVTLGRGLRREDQRHRAIARITLPLWLYVSVTGVAIYLMAHA